MSITERQYQGILKVIEHLNSGNSSRAIREQAGIELMALLKADQFASFVWSPNERRFTEHVFLNMDAENLQRYYAYYQFHNPITGKSQCLRRAVHVNELVPQRELVKTEFYADFLARDGLHYGMNLYVHDGDRNIGDMRIWRNRHHPNFDNNDLQILEIIKPHFCNAMKNILRLSHGQERAITGRIEVIESEGLTLERLQSSYGLTRREAQITLEIAHGKSDREIATSVGVSFSTIRTHIDHIYKKLGIHNRVAIAQLIGAGS